MIITVILTAAVFFTLGITFPAKGKKVLRPQRRRPEKRAEEGNDEIKNLLSYDGTEQI